MQVRLADLKIVSDRLFAHLEELGIEAVEIDRDYYWVVPQEHRYNPYAEPQEHTMGAAHR